METDLIRPVVKVGNSSGIILPKSWMNQEVKVELIIKKTSDIFLEVIKILENEVPLSKILGIYLVGSYAREEEKMDSDIDILLITDSVNKSIKRGKYEFLIISKKKLEDTLKKNILPILPMINESKPLLNESLILEFKKIPLTKRNTAWHIKTTKKAIKENENLIEMTKNLKDDKADDSIAYSLVLRLRGIYIIDCLKHKKIWSNKKFVELIKRISGSTLAYERYIYIKNVNGKNKSELLIEEAEKLLEYVKEKNLEQEKWSKELKE